jgi:DNA-binding LytR/AlgR family response regulator
MNLKNHPRAIIADDEPLLRDELSGLLAKAWPDLEIIGVARNGREAIAQFELLEPDVCFLDVHMPGISGVDVARHIKDKAHIVFITAYAQYAVDAFAHGAIDYLVKPVESVRLAETVLRLKTRLESGLPAPKIEAILERIAAQFENKSNQVPIRWIRASIGSVVSLIPVDDIDFLRSGDKYTSIGWHSTVEGSSEAIIRTPLKELIDQLDKEKFVQVHRSVVVNLNSVSHIVRDKNETANIHLKKRPEVLPVSRSFMHHFRQM